MAITGASKQSYTFYDAKQQSTRLSLYVAEDGTAADPSNDGFQFGVDLAAMSNSSQAASSALRGNGPYTNNPVPVAAGGTGNYQDVADKAVFVFQDAAGGLHKYQCACPKSTIFLADQETVDFTNAAVKQWVADATHTTFGGTVPVATNPVVTRNALPITAAVAGYRRRGKTPRKFNVYTRNPTLTGQGD